MVLETRNIAVPFPFGQESSDPLVAPDKSEQIRRRAEWIFGKSLDQLRSDGISPYLLSPEKRRFDKSFALAALITLAPIIADTLVVAAINHRRLALVNVARKGGVTTKIQTQADGAQDEIAELIKKSGEDYTKLKQSGALKKYSNWLDLWIRRFSLDEAPQLYDLLNGDKTLVGPREPAPDEFEKLDEYLGPERAVVYRNYVQLCGYGIFSIAQVADRGMDIRDRLEYDVKLIQNSSFAVEARIISQVPRAIFFDRGAR